MTVGNFERITCAGVFGLDERSGGIFVGDLQKGRLEHEFVGIMIDPRKGLSIIVGGSL
jgi:hypothetical protein